MKPTIYLDATIPSFYCEERTSTILQAWHELTVEFWDECRDRYALYASDETIREIMDAFPAAKKRKRYLGLIEKLPRLAVTPEVTELARYYLQEGLIAGPNMGDAFHLALATWYRIEFLLTWNCKHLANANKFAHIQVLNSRRRLASPMVVTPEQLVEPEAEIVLLEELRDARKRLAELCGSKDIARYASLLKQGASSVPGKHVDQPLLPRAVEFPIPGSGEEPPTEFEIALHKSAD